jgi:hypothetical protein
MVEYACIRQSQPLYVTARSTLQTAPLEMHQRGSPDLINDRPDAALAERSLVDSYSIKHVKAR